jgi:hypothetical protein
VREKYWWLAENKRLKVQANKLGHEFIHTFQDYMRCHRSYPYYKLKGSIIEGVGLGLV